MIGKAAFDQVAVAKATFTGTFWTTDYDSTIVHFFNGYVLPAFLAEHLIRSGFHQ
jgi:hypothetical protein